jgi:hypothetical protein
MMPSTSEGFKPASVNADMLAERIISRTDWSEPRK